MKKPKMVGLVIIALMVGCGVDQSPSRSLIECREDRDCASGQVCQNNACVSAPVADLAGAPADGGADASTPVPDLAECMSNADCERLNTDPCKKAYCNFDNRNACVFVQIQGCSTSPTDAEASRDQTAPADMATKSDLSQSPTCRWSLKLGDPDEKMVRLAMSIAVNNGPMLKIEENFNPNQVATPELVITGRQSGLKSGDRLEVSVEYETNKNRSWSCIGPGATGKQVGTLECAFSNGSKLASWSPTSNGVGGCNLAGQVP